MIDQEAYGIAPERSQVCWPLHENLTYILKSHVGRVVRWRLMLQEFDFGTQHFPEVVGHHGVSKTLFRVGYFGLRVGLEWYAS
jgi:hypothetical protein